MGGVGVRPCSHTRKHAHALFLAQAHERRDYLDALHREGKAPREVLSGWWLSVLALARWARGAGAALRQLAWDAVQGFQY